MDGVCLKNSGMGESAEAPPAPGWVELERSGADEGIKCKLVGEERMW